VLRVEGMVKPDKSTYNCAEDPQCIDVGSIPLFQNMRSGLIDPDTPDDAKTITTQDGNTQVLVFSDEFNTDGRTFYDGDDPYFQGVDIWYGATQDLEWYSPDALTTKDGVLELEFSKMATHGLNYQSGMLQSWNKMCFKGGTLEASISLPGAGDISGFWPGFWAMGNLGRPGYMATTEGMWPYSYDDVCDAGITANQSDSSGISGLPGMKLAACTCDGEDHPSPGISRSAPEVDVLEATIYPDGVNGQRVGVASQSFQIAPFDVFWQPDLNQAEMYDYGITAVNSYQGSVYQQAISALTTLNNDWYDGKAYQRYAIEMEPGKDGHITWFVGDEPNWRLNGAAIRANGNIGDRVMPQEPMSIVMNFGMSPTFATLELGKLASMLPAKMRIDYIRIYQDEDNQMVTCDPPDYPTTEYIKKHPAAYLNPNKTTWESTGYKWPVNDYVNGCGS
jgi:beta-glucan synthesis-associated protein KRE6